MILSVLMCVMFAYMYMIYTNIRDEDVFLYLYLFKEIICTVFWLIIIPVISLIKHFNI